MLTKILKFDIVEEEMRVYLHNLIKNKEFVLEKTISSVL